MFCSAAAASSLSCTPGFTYKFEYSVVDKDSNIATVTRNVTFEAELGRVTATLLFSNPPRSMTVADRDEEENAWKEGRSLQTRSLREVVAGMLGELYVPEDVDVLDVDAVSAPGLGWLYHVRVAVIVTDRHARRPEDLPQYMLVWIVLQDCY